ncbi:uncharacterized protein Triagg1_8079 [Trichoderma aggressivum f. europaeum]|uniref:Uncharacterized protein n=1 Tax=Trichoderma aggressivum f. europaeum TaxID=173218 RepID=A0AAE1I8X8_9HYPO|nr:hypothetical protein Triagg1_8079 [Trichoderma aggressivum f. europaeum]
MASLKVLFTVLLLNAQSALGIDRVCQHFPYNELLPLKHYPPAELYCSRHFVTISKPAKTLTLTTGITTSTVYTSTATAYVYTTTKTATVTIGTLTQTVHTGTEIDTVYTQTDVVTQYTATSTDYQTTGTDTVTTTVATVPTTITTATITVFETQKATTIASSGTVTVYTTVDTGLQKRHHHDSRDDLLPKLARCQNKILKTACSCIEVSGPTRTVTHTTKCTHTSFKTVGGVTKTVNVVGTTTTKEASTSTISTATTMTASVGYITTVLDTEIDTISTDSVSTLSTVFITEVPTAATTTASVTSFSPVNVAFTTTVPTISTTTVIVPAATATISTNVAYTKVFGPQDGCAYVLEADFLDQYSQNIPAGTPHADRVAICAAFCDTTPGCKTFGMNWFPACGGNGESVYCIASQDAWAGSSTMECGIGTGYNGCSIYQDGTVFHETAGPGVLPEVDASRLESSNTLGNAGAPEVFRGYDGLEVVNGDLLNESNKIKAENEAALATEHNTPQKNARKRLIWIAVGVGVLVVVIVAAVVGGVLGSRHHHDNSSASSSPSSETSSASPAPTSSPPPSAIYSKSSLSVTGWWETTSSYNIRLAYQGNDGLLRMIGYSSDDEEWSTVSAYHADPAPKMGTPIALCCYNATFYSGGKATSSNNYTQIDIFYQGKQDYINEWIIREQKVPVVTTTDTTGTINPKAYKAGPNTRIASYWPSVIFQNEVNQLEEAYFTTQSVWNHQLLNLSSTNHSALAEVPYWGGRTGSANFIYQRDDQRLFAERRVNASVAAAADAPPDTIPSQASIGAFAIPKTTVQDSLMNTYILWRNDTGAIQMTKNDDNNGWQTSSTPDALGSPDEGTDIACLTATNYVVTPIQSKFDMARCYYLVKGKVREVKYDGSTWSVVGDVPLD